MTTVEMAKQLMEFDTFGIKSLRPKIGGTGGKTFSCKKRIDLRHTGMVLIQAEGRRVSILLEHTVSHKVLL